MLYLAILKNTPEGDNVNDIVVDAVDGDAAIEAMRLHGVVGEVERLVEVPPGVFCAEVRALEVTPDEDDADEDDDYEEGLMTVLEPSELLEEFLDDPDDALASAQRAAEMLARLDKKGDDDA